MGNQNCIPSRLQLNLTLKQKTKKKAKPQENGQVAKNREVELAENVGGGKNQRFLARIYTVGGNLGFGHAT